MFWGRSYEGERWVAFPALGMNGPALIHEDVSSSGRPEVHPEVQPRASFFLGI